MVCSLFLLPAYQRGFLVYSRGLCCADGCRGSVLRGRRRAFCGYFEMGLGKKVTISRGRSYGERVIRVIRDVRGVEVLGVV